MQRKPERAVTDVCIEAAQNIAAQHTGHLGYAQALVGSVQVLQVEAGKPFGGYLQAADLQ